MSVSDRRVHFRHYFHPAGHGTFFSGHIRFNDAPSEDFVWVYDCGSRSPSKLDRLIALFATRVAPKNYIDMVCLSHFDSDHVSGIEALLEKVKVGALVLPYLSAQARLGLACALSGSEPFGHRLAALIMDPSRYLSARELRERVDRIILVQGGPGLERDEPSGFEVGPEPAEPLAPKHCEIQVSTRALASDEAGYEDRSWLEVARHDQAWMLGGVYELTFYNRTVPYDQTPQSGASLSDVADEVGHVITKYGLCSSAAPARGWVKELRQIYSRHFGGTASQRNDISLCVLGRPRVLGHVTRPCSKFAREFPHLEFQVPLANESQTAVLMTGDISLDASEVDGLRRHVGPTRWSAVGVMQVPHHGSVHSWRIGLSAVCCHHHSVFCVSPSMHHPHPSVEQDLAGRNPVHASTGQAVAFDYHIALKPT